MLSNGIIRTAARRHGPSRPKVLVRLLAVGLFVVCHAGAGLVTAQTYSVTDLGTLGGNESDAKDINDAGQIVGYAKDAAGRDRAFLWQSGAMTDLGTLSGTESWALAINNLGQVVGEATNAAGRSRAFLWTTAVGMADLGTLGGNNSIAWDINDAGATVGQSDTPVVGVVHAFFRPSGGPMQDIGTLVGGSYAQAMGINASSQVVGWSQVPAVVGFRAFFYAVGGPMSDIGAPGLGGDHSGAMAIDDAGNVVGEAEPVGGGTRPFLYSAGVMADLGSLGGTTARADDINAAGQIVGWSHVPAGTTAHAFVYDAANGLRDLNTLIPSGSGWLLVAARAINESGWIVGYGEIGGEDHAFLLKPDSGGPCCGLPFAVVTVLGLLLGSCLLGRANEARGPR